MVESKKKTENCMIGNDWKIEDDGEKG